jgi:hypothetical protein
MRLRASGAMVATRAARLMPTRLTVEPDV